MPYKDPEKKKAWGKANYEANKEKRLAQKKAYKEANKEKIDASDKAYKEANRAYWKDKDPYEEAEKKGITEKVCPTCSHISGRETLPIKAFALREASKLGVVSQCRDCVAYRQSNYSQNKRKGRRGRHTLTREYFIEVRQKTCVYCGKKSTFVNPNSVDRIDSSKDYTKNNVQPCCDVCNKMKRHHSHEFFIEHSKRMLEHLGYIIMKKGQQTLFGD